MSPTPYTRFFKRALVAMWALCTLVLLFMVVLLVNEMMKSGHDPLAVSYTPTSQAPAPATPDAKENQARDVTLFFGSADGRALAQETRRLNLGGSTVENSRTILLELIKGPSGSLVPIFPRASAPETGIRGVYLLEGGQLVIDLSHDILLNAARSSTCAEALLVYGVTNTLAQADVKGAKEDAVQSVRFLFDGSSPTDRFATHLDLSRPISPNAHWNAAPEATAPAAGSK